MLEIYLCLFLSVLILAEAKYPYYLMCFKMYVLFSKLTSGILSLYFQLEEREIPVRMAVASVFLFKNDLMISGK